MSVVWIFSAIALAIVSQQYLVTGFPFFTGFPSFPSLPSPPSLPSLSSFTLQPMAITPLPFSTSPLGSISFTPKCQVTSNIKDLEFSTIDGGLENEKKVTFICNDKTNRNFYFLKTSGFSSSGKMRETKNAGEYYSLNHKKLDIEKDLDVDQNSVWQAAAKAEASYDTLGALYGGMAPAFVLPSYSSYLSGASKPTCEVVKTNFEESSYPSVDVGLSASEIAKLNNIYSTELCTSPDKTQYYRLKTTAEIVTKSGVKSSKYVIYSYPKGDDGKPDLSRKIGQESGAGAAAGVVASSIMSMQF